MREEIGVVRRRNEEIKKKKKKDKNKRRKCKTCYCELLYKVDIIIRYYSFQILFCRHINRRQKSRNNRLNVINITHYDFYCDINR